MIPTFVAGDKKEHVITTPIIATYNGGGSGGRSVSHELIVIDAPPYEQTSRP
jgi:hypothetical protein